MISRKRFLSNCRVLAAVVVIAALVVGCKQKRQAKFESTAGKSGKAGKKELGLDIQIDPDRSLYQPWSRAKVKLRIKNRSRTPVILVEVSLKTSGGTAVLDESGIQKQPAVHAGSELRIEGAYFVDRVGAKQRAAQPSYWHWKGKDELAVVRLLMPLQERSWTGRFRARYEVGDEFQATVRYVPVPPDFHYYQKVGRKTVRLAKALRRGSMVARTRVVVRFAKKTGVPAHPGAMLDSFDSIGKRKRRRKQDDKREVYALPVTYLDSLPVKTDHASHELGVRRFAFDIARARSKSGVDRGPYTRAVDAGVWVLFGKGKSWVVSRDTVLPVDGNALPFANRLNAGRRQPVYLFKHAEARDPDGLLSYFEKRGFRVDSRHEKDGTYSGVLQLESAKFVPFLRALAARKLRLDGVDAVAAIN